MSLKDYKIEKQLGKGAFGSVTKVTKLSDGKTYAMKNVKIGKLSKPEQESALNEIRILYALDNPNIIYYYEAFFDEPTRSLNIIMEFADDGDIAGKIKEVTQKREHFSEETIWNWIIQMLEGMKYLHSNNIIHRDLKCANIFLTKKGLLKIGDLNVSKVTQSGLAKTQTGTPYYCSPEIWKETTYDQKCDVWSIGCIIYELCALIPPFRGTSLRDLSINILKGRYPPIPSSYSKDLSDLISKMLIVDPKRRYSTDQLLNCDIIQKRIKTIKNSVIPYIVNNNVKNIDNVNMIKTIKLPRNLKDINNKLPKRRKRKNEGEMMMNDEFETKKAIEFKKVSEQLTKNNNNYGYNNLNYNNNQGNNYQNRRQENLYNYGGNKDRALPQNNNNNKNYDYYQQKANNQNLYNKEKHNKPIKIKDPPQKYQRNLEAEKYLREHKEEQKKKELIHNPKYNNLPPKNPKNNNNINNNKKPQNRPMSGNRIISNDKPKPNRYQDFYGGDDISRINVQQPQPHKRPQSGRPVHHQQLQNENVRVPSKQAHRPNAKDILPKRKVVYEKMNYQDYKARNAYKNNNANKYGGYQMNVGNKNNLYKAMGIGDRKGPKIVNHKH